MLLLGKSLDYSASWLKLSMKEEQLKSNRPAGFLCAATETDKNHQII